MNDLSRRESEVLRLIGEGFAVSEIATRLDLSVKTVSTYRNRIGMKLLDAGVIPRRTTAAIMRYAILSEAR